MHKLVALDPQDRTLTDADVIAEPHMGGAYSTIAADVIARYQRMRGKRVRFITGTDEHGEKIAAAAEAAGVPPKEHCDTVSQRYKQLWSMVRGASRGRA